MRLTEIHPAAVHLPIALLPASLALDALAAATGRPGLADAGRLLVGAAFGGAVLASATGALAQGASRVGSGEAGDLLTTHRTLNGGLTLALGAMAAARMARRWPGPGYALLGLGALGAMGYSAWIGGRMSYEHGVGVARAGGLRESAEIGRDRPGVVIAAAMRALGRAAREGAADIARGRHLPALRPGHRAAWRAEAGARARLRA